MNDTIITWNVTNWVTVLVMVGIGYVLVSAGAKVIQNHKAKKAA